MKKPDHPYFFQCGPEPVEFREYKKTIELEFSDGTPLQDLINWIDEKGLKIEDCYIDCFGDCAELVGVLGINRIINENYIKEKEIYDRKKAENDKQLKEYNKALKEYEAWINNKAIEDARKLLESKGLIVVENGKVGNGIKG